MQNDRLTEQVWSDWRQAVAQKVADIEKAAHFLETRQDSSCGLQSDWRRHVEQEQTARQAIMARELSQADRERELKELSEQAASARADRRVALLRGSCFAPFLFFQN